MLGRRTEGGSSVQEADKEMKVLQQAIKDAQKG